MKLPLLLALFSPLTCAAIADAQAPLGRAQSTLSVRHVPIRTTRLDVQVTVADGVATTTLSQRLRNEAGPAQAEAIWILPLPEGAAADGFEMTVGGVKMESEVLGADHARGVYEDIVRRRRDPGLLEYVGRGCLRARVFPIPRGEEITVGVTFRHVLPREDDLVRWSFPVAEVGVGGAPPDQVVLDFTVQSTKEIKNAFSSLAAVDVVRKSDHLLRASYEGSGHGLAEEELELFYGLSDSEFGLHLMTHRAEDAEEGTFLMLLAPKRTWNAEEVQAREITFVVDTSGSMALRKLQQAKESLRYFLNSLNPGDRFNVVPFSTEARPFFPRPVDATVEHLSEALQRVRTLEAVGGTNIADALRAGLEASEDRGERVPLVVFLTDGLPTVGKKEPAELLALVEKHNEAEARVFVLGVGADVNTVLLDSVAANTRGSRNYVGDREDIERKAGGLLRKLSHPVLSDLELSVEGLEVTRLVPGTLADLFAGEQLEIVGRYRGAGPRAIRLRGRFQGVEREYVFEGSFAEPGTSRDAFLEALWAQRRVGLLLDEIRRNGELEELVDEVTRLGETHDLVTPYTSHLILEDTPIALGLEPTRRRGGADQDGLSGPTRPYRGPGDTNAPTSVAGRRSSGGGNVPMTPGPSLEAESGGSGFFLGRGGDGEASSERAVEHLTTHLTHLEVLAVDARPDDYRALAVQLLPQLEDAERQVRLVTSDAVVGEEAVQRSEYLKDLFAGRGAGDLQPLRRLFERVLDGRTFRLRHGRWEEAGLTLENPDGTARPRQEIEAFSDAYFRWIREHEASAAILTLGERVLFEHEGALIEVVPPVAEEPATQPESAERGPEAEKGASK